MSGIYIPNVNLPESCDECPHPTCRLWQSVNGGERHEKCPIVPVPKHGRLIDADAFFDFILNIYKNAQGDARKAYRDVLDTIVAAGDVIEAEEGDG